jgi:uncharacterized protein
MLDDIASRFLYYPEPTGADVPPPRWAGDAIEVWMKADDGIDIHGLWWGDPAESPVILFLHGNAQNAYDWSLVRDDLSELECRMLLIDYHGYGKSGGEPSEEALYADGRASLRWLENKGVPLEQTVVFGKSLGGAVACEISQGLDLKGVVLESTFTSLASVARNLFGFLKGYKPLDTAYDSLSKIPGITCPKLFVHGDSDELIPVREGLALYRAAGEPKDLYTVRGAGHNDVSVVAGREYGRRLSEWLADTPGVRARN